MSSIVRHLGLSGNVSLKAHRGKTAPARTWSDWASVWRWRVSNFFQVRLWELPLECWLLACWVATKLVRGANMPVHGRLWLTLVRGDGTVLELGCAGCHTVTTVGKAYVAACFDNTNEPENLKYHGFGTGTNMSNASDTALQTELTTQYATDSTRPTGSQAHSSNTYTTVGTLAPDSGGTIAVTEWGLFSASSSTTLFDRQTFSAVNLVAANGDTLSVSYVLTLS